VSPGGTPRTISAAAFRRQQQGRVPSGPGPGSGQGMGMGMGMGMGTETTLGPADTSPLMLRKPSGSPLPMLPTTGSGSVRTRAPLSVVNPDPGMSPDEEEGGHEYEYGGESVGYGAGRYVSDLE